VLRAEPDAEQFTRAIENSTRSPLSAANFLETAIVIDLTGDPVASRRFDDFVKEAEIQIEPVTEHQAHLARAAYRDFGKGSKHRAKLNFGDCFAYALAKDKGEPLLFKGSDFRHTDVTSALK
jgi:ribonuclease VapC